jgi:hypothetical protein
MNWNRLHGVQYVRLAPGVAQRVAPYVGVDPAQIDELVLDLPVWPEEIRPSPLVGRNGLLIAGDPILLDATDAGLLLAGGAPQRSETATRAVLVPWEDIRNVQVLGPAQEAAGA